MKWKGLFFQVRVLKTSLSFDGCMDGIYIHTYIYIQTLFLLLFA